MAFPNRPDAFVLSPRERFLKAFLAGTASAPSQGVTQPEFDSISDFGWRVVISRFIGQFDVSGWGSNPPHPIQEIWELTASGIALRIYGQRFGLNDKTTDADSRSWIKMADQMIANILDPDNENQRMYLVSATTGSIIEPRTKLNLPIVLNVRGVEFFPSLRSYSYKGQSSMHSVEQFWQDFTVEASDTPTTYSGS